MNSMRTPHRKWRLALMAVAVLVIAIMVLSPSSPPPSAPTIPPFAVEVTQSQAQSYTPVVVLRGVTSGNKEVTIRAASDAILMKRPFSDGSFANKGDIIAQLDPEDKQAQLLEAQALLKQRTSELKAAESLSLKGHRSAIEKQRATAAHATAYARVQTILNQLEKRTITAPFDGIIFNHQADEGQFMRSGDVIVSMVSLTPLVIAADASEKDMPFIEKGQKAHIRLTNGQMVDATVTYKAPATTTNARTFRIEAETPNDDANIPSGFSVELIVQRQSILAHRIHASLLSLDDDGRLGVKIMAEGNIARFITVTAVGEDTDGIWITGLPQRSTIITRGQGFILDGATVMPHEKQKSDTMAF